MWNDKDGRRLLDLKVHQVTLAAIEGWTGIDFGALKQVDGARLVRGANQAAGRRDRTRLALDRRSHRPGVHRAVPAASAACARCACATVQTQQRIGPASRQD